MKSIKKILCTLPFMFMAALPVYAQEQPPTQATDLPREAFNDTKLISLNAGAVLGFPKGVPVQPNSSRIFFYNNGQHTEDFIVAKNSSRPYCALSMKRLKLSAPTLLSSFKLTAQKPELILSGTEIIFNFEANTIAYSLSCHTSGNAATLNVGDLKSIMGSEMVSVELSLDQVLDPAKVIIFPSGSARRDSLIAADERNAKHIAPPSKVDTTRIEDGSGPKKLLIK